MDARTFCRSVMHEYERQWSQASGHAVRHPLRLKMDRLQEWCDRNPSGDELHLLLIEGAASEDVGVALLSVELAPLWESVQAGRPLGFHP